MKIYLLLPLLFIGIVANGQKNSSQNFTEYVDPVKALSFKERAYVGFEVFGWPLPGAQFLDLWPTFSYQFTQDFRAGTGPVFIYSDKNYTASSGATFRLDDTMYGLRSFVTYRLPEDFLFLSGLKLRAELDGIYGNEAQLDGSFTNEWVPALNLGVTFDRGLFRIKGSTISFVYNVLYDVENAPLPSRFTYRFGFNF